MGQSNTYKEKSGSIYCSIKCTFLYLLTY